VLPFVAVPGAKQKQRVQDVLQFVTVCCSVLRGVAVQGGKQKWGQAEVEGAAQDTLQYVVAVGCSASQCVAVHWGKQKRRAPHAKR